MSSMPAAKTVGACSRLGLLLAELSACCSTALPVLLLSRRCVCVCVLSRASFCRRVCRQKHGHEQIWKRASDSVLLKPCACKTFQVTRALDEESI